MCAVLPLVHMCLDHSLLDGIPATKGLSTWLECGRVAACRRSFRGGAGTCSTFGSSSNCSSRADTKPSPEGTGTLPSSAGAPALAAAASA